MTCTVPDCSNPGVLYKCGRRCDQHSPAAHKDTTPVTPDPARTLDGLRAKAGIPHTHAPVGSHAVIDRHAIASGKRRSSPEQFAQARAEVEQERRMGRRYGKKDAGPPCLECRKPLVRALADAGETIHPTCDPAWPTLVRLSQAAEARHHITVENPPEGNHP